MFMDEKNQENSGAEPIVSHTDTPSESVGNVSETPTTQVASEMTTADSLMTNNDTVENTVPLLPPAKFNLMPYLAVVVSILVIGTGLIFVLEKQDRISTGLFTQVITAMEAKELIAKVNEKTITRMDYDSSFNQLKDIQADQGADITSEAVLAQLKTQAIDTLVNAEILRQEAVAAGLTATAEQIDTRFNEIQEGLGGKEVLEARMAEFGVTEASLRRDIENEFLIQQLFTANLPAATSIEVTNEEVLAVYEQAGGTAAGLPPLEDVRVQIEDQVRVNKEQQSISAYIDSLRSAAEIEILI